MSRSSDIYKNGLTNERGKNENRNLTNKKINRFRNKFGMTRKPNGHAELVSAFLLY